LGDLPDYMKYIAGLTSMPIAILIQDQNIGVGNYAEWYTIQGSTKYFLAGFATVLGGSYRSTKVYTVPANKTFYITYASCTREVSPGGIAAYVYLVPAPPGGSTLVALAGYQGAAMTYPTPMIAPAGYDIYVQVHNPETTTGDMYVAFGGYEI